ncbi:hypothetical protein Kpho01_61830 [Kitasatospora phosalacinea]|uniref:Uncharacterized protein n=1 Tax=Kitasatospora phosalacinea TaxID=2065 RepID=A0A9W6PNC7_9ACTN|nr:hypothetical protein Kpho01_61830 [Kitasatospora phosalacinea]
MLGVRTDHDVGRGPGAGGDDPGVRSGSGGGRAGIARVLAVVEGRVGEDGGAGGAQGGDGLPGVQEDAVGAGGQDKVLGARQRGEAVVGQQAAVLVGRPGEAGDRHAVHRVPDELDGGVGDGNS